ncbi:MULTISPECIES: DUF2850 domain-containing protein [Vibrio]|jgi:hypothetical protein|uniref:DUF2850 domain-containing protein n=1 Tax=Vibrio echinoideorum TaxID=2100116 RepID=A0ABU9FMN6_9VIBR|nr:DUF2850 domain-containing protein [Vibrio sp. L3-7]MCF7505989.1 DUF2850 domain-containing protein [Vibrio sp. L3-7]OED72328.1 hypothetical protein A143_16925 [Vibrio splendidus ZS-139]TVU65147.1 DUF2850 domain-containing protein [Vibrio atlanticus]TVU70917.1 DUF2850 domain-containing protein [Vibrio tasmaniensis]
MAKKPTKSRDIFANSLLYSFLLAGFMIALTAGYFAYQAHQQSVSPNNVHGTWIEIGAPPYKTDILTLSDNGVMMNHRFISTSFDFDGKVVTVNTGSGPTIYTISGTYDSPRLKRLFPSTPSQQFIKEGYEETATGDTHSVMQQRRASLAEQFKR